MTLNMKILSKAIIKKKNPMSIQKSANGNGREVRAAVFKLLCRPTNQGA